jgi:dolichol-phosphate mannosyltransferase
VETLLTTEMNHPIVSLVIPTYNEGENIEQAVKRASGVLRDKAVPFELIVVDDDSPDRTWEVAEQLTRDYPELRIIRRRNERGLARAVVRGWREARGDILAVMDGDLQHPSETLGQLIDAIQKDDVDIAVASRHVKGGGVSRWNVFRRIVSWLATLAATWLLPGTLRTVRDPMSGYFALRRSVIEGSHLEPEGYKILLEVLGRGHYRRVEEVPYIFVERTRGGSKLGPRQYGEYVIHLIRLSWQTGELGRLLKFSAVGGSGVFVNMGALTFMTSMGVSYVAGGVIAVETAIVTNFLLNEFWSFSDFSRRRPGISSRVMRFLKFNFFCAGGAVINMAFLWTLTEYAGVYYLVSNLIGIAAATVWNYGMNANITWESARAERLSRASGE